MPEMALGQGDLLQMNRDSYLVLTREEIEILREELLADDGWLEGGKERVQALCSMALQSLQSGPNNESVGPWKECVYKHPDAPNGPVGEVLAALKDLCAMYAHAWDRVDGALVMMADSVERFERCHERAREAIEKAESTATDGGNK